MPDALAAAEMLNRLGRYTRTRAGVSFSTFPKGSTVYFGSFGRTLSAHYRGDPYTGRAGDEQGTPGNGARVMRLVCRVADAFDTPIDLFTYNLGLVRYYRRFGFSITGKPRAGYITMRRLPRCSNPPLKLRSAA